MSEKRQVSSLEEAFSALLDGADWEFSPEMIDSIPGMGLGASEQAKLLAFRGLISEWVEVLESDCKRPANRPKKEKRQNLDARRARFLWRLVRMARDGLIELPKGKLTNRLLIAKAQEIERAQRVPDHDRLFKDGEHNMPALETSVWQTRQILFSGQQ